MAHYTTIKELLYETIHRSKKTVPQIADEMGISANYLYRAGLPTDGSGVKFPLEFLVPLMKTTKNYNILKHLARLCGFILVKEPRFRGYRGDEIDLVDEYQEVTTKAVRLLKTFLSKPTFENYSQTVNALDAVMEKSAQAHRYAQKKARGQLELDL
ncbi:hypothetical protein Calab_1484 [Caldithrix abyssi DSM 13497]|uniref:Uncharacterized protein n=1 Tax=Caldithrix abyssi DSM 13497 TaxID=880073 RepID=H1XPX9_CALAY|nr:phage regulatory CII family protein [Caldithrix abyssi]APF20366.1 hypothetical protein Cabys_3620 [Caldithrix abyssi DSM 13497]EHO41105.1 hypothetical protein Calab_1484 [Caldithrix abyssi DSM 13497]